MNDTSADPLHDFRRVNVDATLRLARQAAEAGVSRFIFLSSIKVNGESTEGGTPFTSVSPECPVDPYGLSKYEAEQGLRALASEMGIDVVIIRPVLVYGPGVGANFQRMVVWLEKGIPLPLGALSNKRSMVALDNLIDLIVTCLDHPAAGNQTFLVSDDHDLSTTELLVAMGHALDKPARLLPVPVRLIWWGAALLGKQEVARRVCGSLQVDITHTRNTLDWTPPVSLAEGLKRTTQAGRSKA
jgi:nucleoside-diphosphate-sugar epimerase